MTFLYGIPDVQRKSNKHYLYMTETNNYSALFI